MTSDTSIPPISEISQDDKDKIGVHLLGKNLRNCELCGNAKWILGDYIVAPIALNRTAEGPLQIALGGKIYPSIVLQCDNCGNTKLLNCGILGIASILKIASGSNG